MNTKTVIKVGAAAGLAIGLYQVYNYTQTPEKFSINKTITKSSTSESPSAKPSLTNLPSDTECTIKFPKSMLNQRESRENQQFMMKELINGGWSPGPDSSHTPTTAESMELLISKAQKTICSGLPVNLEEWKIDSWKKPGNTGGGCTCVVQQDKNENEFSTNIFEKAGVNVSVVSGSLTEGGEKQMTTNHPGLPKRDEEGKLPFKAMGISSVLHPHNPHIPTLHFNFRYFEVTGKDKITNEEKQTWWFGGGIDLTPSYLYTEDIVHFHSTLKKVCDKHNYSYPEFKEWCDNYFVNKHRNNERRGVGGVFFDDIDDRPQVEILSFIQDMTEAVLDCYLPIVEKRKNQSFTEEEKTWQAIRRGRYVEFNICYDRGTKFGLMTPGSRIESILVSLPRYASWEYSHDEKVAEGSREAELLKVCRVPKDWLK